MTIGRSPDSRDSVDPLPFAERLEATDSFCEEAAAEFPDIPRRQRALAMLAGELSHARFATRFGGSRWIAEHQVYEETCRFYERLDAERRMKDAA